MRTARAETVELRAQSARHTAQDAMERYLQACETQGLASGTLALRRLYLQQFIQWLLERDLVDLRRVSSTEIAAYQRDLRAHRYCWSKAADAPRRPLKPQSVRVRLLMVRRFFAWLCRQHVLLADPTSGLDLGRFFRTLPANVLTEGEMTALLAAADVCTPIGMRNRAILELLYSTGLRVAELAALDLTDLDLTAGALFVRCGKGGRQRVAPLGDTAIAALLDYLQNTRPRFHRRPGVAALFLAATHCGSTGNRLSKAGIRMVVQQTARAAGIERTISPHAIRHACATHMLRAGAGLRHIQQLLGHSRIDTTEIYTHVDVSDLADVLARTHPRCK